MEEKSPVAIAAEIVGSQAALARALGVKSPTVHQWITGERPVPADHCPTIERLTGGVVTCEQLNDSVDWAYIRATPLTA